MLLFGDPVQRSPVTTLDHILEVKFAWKVQRDVAERGWTEEQVKQDIEKRLPDFSAYVDPQKANADVVLRYEPSDKGLPFLKVCHSESSGNKRAKLKGTNGGKFAVLPRFLLIFADFRVSWELQHFTGAD